MISKKTKYALKALGYLAKRDQQPVATAAARLLGVTFRSMRYRLKKLGLD